jgi:hypothetical protein
MDSFKIRPEMRTIELKALIISLLAFRIWDEAGSSVIQFTFSLEYQRVARLTCGRIRNGNAAGSAG